MGVLIPAASDWPAALSLMGQRAFAAFRAGCFHRTIFRGISNTQ
jgi:hypothetical protein